MDENVGDGIEFVFSHSANLRVETELQDKGATQTGEQCGDCNGLLYSYHNEVICGNCSRVYDGSSRDPSPPTLWERFVSQRPRYTYSNRQRCVGGFPNKYDWVKSDDIDGSVSTVDPDSFYK